MIGVRVLCRFIMSGEDLIVDLISIELRPSIRPSTLENRMSAEIRRETENLHWNVGIFFYP